MHFLSATVLHQEGEFCLLCISEEKPANQECEGCEADLLGEGKESGEINTAQSLVFTTLQVMDGPGQTVLRKP